MLARARRDAKVNPVIDPGPLQPHVLGSYCDPRGGNTIYMTIWSKYEGKVKGNVAMEKDTIQMSKCRNVKR